MEYIKGFPSPYLPKKIKMTSKYALACAQAMHKQHKSGLTSPFFGFKADSEIANYRKYARGEQDTSLYKTRLQHMRNLGKGKSNLSFLNVDWSILAVAPKFVNNLVGKILDVELDVTINAIDPVSVSEKMQKKFEIIGYMKSKKLLETLEAKNGINFDDMSPIPEGVPEPESAEDIESYMQMFFKNQLAEDYKDLIDIGFEHNNIKQVMSEYVTNLIEIGPGCLFAELDASGTPKLYGVDPEDITCSNSKYDDFRDVTEFGFYQNISISNLRVIWPGQSEAVYKKIANDHTGNKYSGDFEDHYRDYHCYPYDAETVRVYNCTWKTVDKTNYVIKKKGDSQTLYEKDDQWLEGIDENQYKERHPDREPIKKELEVWYGCKWIVGSNYVFDYGPKTNLMRDSSNLSKVKPNFILRKVDPFMKIAKPILDEIQINFLKFKQHVSNSRPNSLSIEMSAFEHISLSKSGKKLEPKEALALYFETGTILWRRKDWRGSGAQFKPIEEMKNGINDSAFQHLNIVIQMIDLLREVSGLPQVSDGTVPDPRQGKAVTQISMGGVKETLKKLYNAYIFTYNDSAKKLLDLTQDSITFYGGDMYKKAIGVDSVVFMKMVKGINSREWAIEIKMGYTDEQRAEIHELIIKYETEGRIDPEVAYMLKHIKNPYKATLLLKQNSERNRKRQMEDLQAQQQGELTKNTESVKASLEAEMQKAEHKNKLDKDFELFKANLEESLEDKKANNQMLLKMLESEGDEKDRIVEMAKARISQQNKQATKKATA